MGEDVGQIYFLVRLWKIWNYQTHKNMEMGSFTCNFEIKYNKSILDIEIPWIVDCICFNVPKIPNIHKATKL